jgi:prolyl oligopeptidase
MRACLIPPPFSEQEPVTEILHGVSVTDPYRWLEDQDSLRTRAWIAEQVRYARGYLDAIPGRDPIRQRIRDFLAVETYDSLQKVGPRYFFRKRLPNQEQPCIYMRERPDGEDKLLIDPSAQGKGNHTAVKLLRVSPDGRLLLYEIKEGGERTGTFALLDIQSHKTLPDILSRGYLHGFAFKPDGKSFYYVHEPLDSKKRNHRAAYHHVLGTNVLEDRETFSAGEDPRLRLGLIADTKRLGFLVYRFLDKTQTDFYLKRFEDEEAPERIVADAEFAFGPLLIHDRILAITDRNAPNLRIVELRTQAGGDPEWVDLIPERNMRIYQWTVTDNSLFVSYIRQTTTEISNFDLTTNRIREIPTRVDQSVHLIPGSPESDEVFFETESFTEPIATYRYSPREGKPIPWAKRKIPFDSPTYKHGQVWYTSKDGMKVPMFLLGRGDVLSGGCHPTIMTSYGGYGVSMTPQFSVFVSFLIERGCLFALPNIRGGSEFGAEWYEAAKRHKRQTAYDDFLSAAEWLIQTGRTTPERLAIFGGSNSGLLVAAAMTQQPNLFRAVVCMVPMLDMLRYHLFDNAHLWRDEFGTAEDADDFEALLHYSPYHRVREGVSYPATMIVSGDADHNCNPLHARKMTARLQAANSSGRPILLDYSPFRGHSPVLPLSERVEALTDRMAFLCEQLQLPVRDGGIFPCHS